MVVVGAVVHSVLSFGHGAVRRGRGSEAEVDLSVREPLLVAYEAARLSFSTWIFLGLWGQGFLEALILF